MMSGLEREIRPVVTEAPPGWAASLAATAVTHVRPVFSLFASSAESELYRALEERCWEAAGGPGGPEPAALRADFLRLWPYPDRPPGEDDVDFDLYTPVYWKLRVLDPLEFFTGRPARPARGDHARAVSACVVAAQENLENIAYEAAEAEADEAGRRFLHELPEQDKERIRDAVAAPSPVDAQTALRLRRGAEEHAAVIEREVLPRWIRANGWSEEDLLAAQGVQRA